MKFAGSQPVMILLLLSLFCEKVMSQSRPDYQLSICIVDEIPNAHNANDLYNLHRIMASVSLAEEHLKSYILPAPLTAKFHYIDAGVDCSSVQPPIVAALKLFATGSKCSIFVGPGCSSDADATYSFSEFYGIPMIAIPSADIESIGNPREDYSLLIRLSYTFVDVCNTLVNLLRYYNYIHTTIFVDDTQDFYGDFGATLIKFYKKSAPIINANSRTKTLKTGDRVVNDDEIKAMLVDANTTSRVFILLTNGTFLRRFMLIADQLQLTNGEYVYFAFELFESKYWGSFNWKTGGITDPMAREAYRSVKVITMIQSQDSNYDAYSIEVRKIAQDKFNYSFGIFESIDPITVGFYEAVILYGEVVRDLYHAGRNYSDPVLVANSMKNKSFNSPVNGLINTDALGDKYTDYGIKTFDDTTGFAQIVMTYNNRVGLRFVGNMTWPYRNSSPPDEPYCGFSDEAERCKVIVVPLGSGIIAVAVILPLLFLISLICVLLYIFIKRNTNSFNFYWWRIPEEDLQIVSAAVSVQSKNSSRNDMDTQATKSIKTTSDAQSYRGSYFDNRAYYMGTVVVIREVTKNRVHTTSELLDDLRLVKLLVHDNIHKLIGITVSSADNTCVHVVAEQCSHGSLQDVLVHETIKLDWAFKNSMIRDIVMGMNYIHDSPMVSHGDFSGYTCMVDSRFTVKISDAGLWLLRDPETLVPPSSKDNEGRDFEMLLWRAPELLRSKMPSKGSQKGDIYSFGIILQQIILRAEAYSIPDDIHSSSISKEEIVLEVQKGTDPPLRPRVPRSSCSNELYSLMEQCWSEYPLERPTFVRIRDNLKKIIGKMGDNIVDHLLKRMEQYAGELELQVQEKTRQFMSEKQRSEDLLNQLLPKSVAEALTKGQSVDPESYESVTIYFSDIVQFTTISATGSPMDVVVLLNSLYTLFDTVIEAYDVYKVETIGDSYMVCSGLPLRNGNRHAKEIALMSIGIRDNMVSFVIPHRREENVKVRIGCHTGPCVAGIVGLKMPRFCLFGDTVNTASRMESTSEPMKIQLSEATHDCLADIGGFAMESRGPTNVKGKGVMNTFWLIKAA